MTVLHFTSCFKDTLKGPLQPAYSACDISLLAFCDHENGDNEEITEGCIHKAWRLQMPFYRAIIKLENFLTLQGFDGTL